MKNMDAQIVHLYSMGKRDELRSLRAELIKKRMKMDNFFSRFLEDFEMKMNYEETDTPVWKLYREKTSEYSELESTLKRVEHFLAR